MNIDLNADNEYNKEPVYYCKRCMSLNIQTIGENSKVSGFDFCTNCGGTEIETTDIFTWRNLYKKRFNKNFEEV